MFSKERKARIAASHLDAKGMVLWHPLGNKNSDEYVVILNNNIECMTRKHKIQIFEDKRVRTVWDDELEEWYFSIVDVCGVLTEQKTSRGASTYWAVLKNRLLEEGAGELLTKCKQLKMRAADGKMRLWMAGKGSLS